MHYLALLPQKWLYVLWAHRHCRHSTSPALLEMVFLPCLLYACGSQEQAPLPFEYIAYLYLSMALKGVAVLPLEDSQ